MAERAPRRPSLPAGRALGRPVRRARRPTPGRPSRPVDAGVLPGRGGRPPIHAPIPVRPGAGLTSATFRPSRLPDGRDRGAANHLATRLPEPQRAGTVVARVTPSADRVPENLLKFYLHFSAPMSRGEVYDRVRLLDARRPAVDLPFLGLGEELWDPTALA